VRALNLHSICPFSLDSLVPYGQREQPHCSAYASAAKQAVPTKHAVLRRESAEQFSVTAIGQAGNTDSSYDRAYMMPRLAPQQELTGQPLGRAMESAGLSHIPGQLKQLFIPVEQQHFIFLAEIVSCLVDGRELYRFVAHSFKKPDI